MGNFRRLQDTRAVIGRQNNAVNFVLQLVYSFLHHWFIAEWICGVRVPMQLYLGTASTIMADLYIKLTDQ
jgi:hypothetical protein